MDAGIGLRIAASGTTVADLVVPSILNNATSLFTPTYGPMSLNFQSVDRWVVTARMALKSVLASHWLEVLMCM